MEDEESDKRKFSNRVQRWKTYIEISNLGAIVRRYFVMNAFDGALTMLGVVIGASLANIQNPLVIISAGLSGSFAMGISGFSGAYMAESAERTKELKVLEKAMLREMDEDSMHKEAARFATRVTAVVDALSPALAALVVISPYFFVHYGYMDMSAALVCALLLTLTILSLLGVYLARVTEESMMRHGLKMLIVGLITALLCSLVAIGLGGTVV
ncbi:MAG: VIT1/CCC1 transporter family protein [Thermoplasmata archaeon]|nr:VIT1/CCC1 transporter family protein [Thermoplasmata archaeon]